MKLKQLRHFVSVAEELHFGRAAARIGMEQSPLSRAVRQLEKELKLTLLIRTTRRTELTAAGAIVLRCARKILGSVDEAHAQIGQLSQGTAGELRIGAGEGLLSAQFSAYIRQLSLESPEVRFVTQELAFEEQLVNLHNGTLDGGLAYRQIDNPTLVSEQLGKHELLAAMHRDHPLSLKDALSLSELSRAPIILARSLQMAGAEETLQTLLGERAVIVANAATVSNLVTQVSSGLALGLLTEAQAAWINHPDIVFRPFSNKRNYLPLYLVRPRGRFSALLDRLVARARAGL